MNVIYRYSDYNPSYSHPGMPMSTPTSFQNFVTPRPPANMKWPQEQYTPLARRGQDTSRRPSRRRAYLSASRELSSPQLPFPQLLPWGVGGGVSEPSPYEIPDMYDIASNYLSGRGQPTTSPANQFRGGGASGGGEINTPPRIPYRSNYQQIVTDPYYNEPLPALFRRLGLF